MPSKVKTYLIHSSLFIVTLITTTLAGAEWKFGRSFVYGDALLGWPEFVQGFYFSIPFLAILTVHEFGHYFTAKFHKARVSLPYYIPMWLGIVPAIGTMGAFIRIKTPFQTRKQYFDVGIAGPLAGFILALGVLFYGFTHLPPPEYIYSIHPEYKAYGLEYDKYVYTYQYQRTQDSLLYVQMQADAKALATEKGEKYVSEPFEPREEYVLALGTNLIFEFFEEVVADKRLVPNHYEMIHYPFLFAGFLALLFTALNLIPIGQLDGGHILYSLIGERNHRKASAALFIGFVFYAGLGFFTPQEFSVPDTIYYDKLLQLFLYIWFLNVLFSRLTENRQTVLMTSLSVVAAQFVVCLVFPNAQGYMGWLVFSFILGRFLGIYHPNVPYDEPLDWKRKVLGWFALVVFILCVSPMPFSM